MDVICVVGIGIDEVGCACGKGWTEKCRAGKWFQGKGRDYPGREG